MRQFLRICKTIVLMGGCIILASCAATPTKPEPETPAYVPKFDFTPPSQAQTTSAEVTFGIVSPSYSKKEDWIHHWPFNKFCENMAADFQELLSARGFTIRGPFKSYEEMTYPDKKGADLILEPSLEVDVAVPSESVRYEEHIVFLGTHQYTLSGDVVLRGRVTLSIAESLSKERMWFKSIELPQTVLRWQGTKKRPMLKASDGSYVLPANVRIDLDDPGFTQAIGKPIEDFYIEVLQTAWKHLEPEEMRIIKKQAQEIKEKKAY